MISIHGDTRVTRRLTILGQSSAMVMSPSYRFQIDFISLFLGTLAAGFRRYVVAKA